MPAKPSRPIDDPRLGDDSLCRRCGVCCMGTLRINGRAVAVRSLACRYLKEVGAGRFDCTVYASRHDQASWCLSIQQAIEAEVLAADCPYRVIAKTAGSGPVRLSSAQEARLADPIREAARKDPPPWRP